VDITGFSLPVGAMVFAIVRWELLRTGIETYPNAPRNQTCWVNLCERTKSVSMGNVRCLNVDGEAFLLLGCLEDLVCQGCREVKLVNRQSFRPRSCMYC
jgi:hypothetical protein